MSASVVKGNPPRSGKGNRRRKKRRTEDFSSDSDSSSSSSSDEETKNTTEEAQHDEIEHDMDIDSIDLESDEEKNNKEEESLDIETKINLAKVSFTSSEVSNLSNKNKLNSINDNQIKQTISKSREELNGEFLKLMASGFSEDLDELRKKPDFTEKSLVMLAKTLQSGANMFDDETLDAMFSK